ncbi:hypothetical protein [Spiroplasma endosymbiont of Aspidapion aeneum]|uniref:hypothetical protein n=1 Tax=Spiroplasma endosymbiont of Aspidapion aeneum TaxID=3066276 RepID=UPI00313D4FB5
MPKKDDELEDFFSEIDLFKELRDTKIKDEDKSKFLNEIKTNWYLDSDSINFLIENNINFFTFIGSKCFCMSNKNFENCHLSQVSNIIDDKYICSYEALKDNKLWEQYLHWSKNFILQSREEFDQNIKCQFIDCNNNAKNVNLYQNLDLGIYLSSVKENFLDIMSIMGSVFFKQVEPEAFIFSGLCTECDKKITTLEKNIDKLSDLEKISVLYRTVLFKKYFLGFKHFILTKEYLQYYNSIKLDGYKNLMTYHIKKVLNEYIYICELQETFKEVLKSKENNKLSIFEFRVKGEDNFTIKDTFMPQVIPETFETINANNNLFIKSRMGVINIFKIKDEFLAIMCIDRNDVMLKNYFSYWKNLLKNYTKETECFITNISLIVSDNILVKEEWFNKLDINDKVVISMFNKIRFDSPKDGKDLLTIKMLSNFGKGNNFFSY